MTSKRGWMMRIFVVMMLCILARPASALRIRDAVRMKNEVPNEIMGMGLVVGLPGTGDGDDYLPAMRPLAAMMNQFEDYVDPKLVQKELKNSKNVAIVSISMPLPIAGAHAGDKLDLRISAIAAKSLRGGRLIFVPLVGPDHKILAWGSGDLVVDSDNPAKATIRGGGVMIYDVLPEDIHDNTFTLVIKPDMRSRELATAIADQINEDVAPQTSGRWVAYAVDGTSVQVTIPEAEQHNPTPYIARLMTLPLPSLPDKAIVTISKKDKLITFSDEVEVAPTMICQGTLTITIGTPPTPTGTKAPFVIIDPHGSGNAKLRDLQNAFNLLKVSPEDRIAIVEGLAKSGALKAEVKYD